MRRACVSVEVFDGIDEGPVCRSNVVVTAHESLPKACIVCVDNALYLVVRRHDGGKQKKTRTE